MMITTVVRETRTVVRETRTVVRDTVVRETLTVVLETRTVVRVIIPLLRIIKMPVKHILWGWPIMLSTIVLNLDFRETQC
jgi:hypothetical protein